MTNTGKVRWKAAAIRAAAAMSVLGLLALLAVPATTPAQAGDDDDGPPFGECPGNIVPDNEVNIVDLLAVLSTWGECPTEQFCPSDLNDDNAINVDDLLLVLANWGQCPDD